MDVNELWSVVLESAFGAHKKQLWSLVQLYHSKLPVDNSAHICVEDLVSFVKHAKPSVSQLAQYLQRPPYVSLLADFAQSVDQKESTPHHILCFNPYAALPCNRFDHVSMMNNKHLFSFTESAKSINVEKEKKEAKLSKDLQLEKWKEEQKQIFKRDLESTGLVCQKCKKGDFIRLREKQVRRSDELSTHVYQCMACDPNLR
jgi:DNA-directed RNA polymerase subunit M/transcription elongation factor TFIIS